MNRTASLPLKLAYCLTVLCAIVPFGLANSGWVGLATGGSAFLLLPIVGPILFFALGLYRIVLVARVAGTLDSNPVAGVSAALRAFGIFCIYVGAAVGLLNWLSRPLMHLLIKTPSFNGIEYFAVGVVLSVVVQIGVLGLFSFEFSRLLAFERNTRELPRYAE